MSGKEQCDKVLARGGELTKGGRKISREKCRLRGKELKDKKLRRNDRA